MPAFEPVEPLRYENQPVNGFDIPETALPSADGIGPAARICGKCGNEPNDCLRVEPVYFGGAEAHAAG